MLKDVITGRQLCADWYATLAEESQQGESENNKTHQYFLDVLKQIYEVLQREHKSRRPKRKKKMPQLPTDTGDLTNLFQHLGLEETTDENSESSEASSGRKPKMRQPVVNTKLEDSKHEREEMMFAVWAMLHDLHEVRIFNRKIIKRFLDGEISFMAVAQATTDAMQVGSSISHQFRQQHPALEGFDDVIRLVGIEHFFNTANKAQYSGNVGSGWREANEEAELLCVDGWTVAVMAKTVLALEHVTRESGTHLLHDLLPRKETPCHPLGMIFVNALCELGTLHHLNPYESSRFLWEIWSFTDFYTFNLFNFAFNMLSERLDFGLVFASSLYCDIHDAMMGKLGSGFDVCNSLVMHHWGEGIDQLQSLMEKEYKFSYEATPASVQWMPPEKKFVVPCATKEGIEGWNVQRKGLDTFFVPRTLLEMFPLLAAEIARQVCEFWESFGAQVCNWKQVVLSAAHLHKALVAGHQAERWSDLNFLMRAQDSSSRPLLRQNEAEVDMVFKEYALALGFPLNQVSGTRRPKLKSGGKSKYPDALQLQPALCSAHEKRETAKMNDRLGLKISPGDLRDVYNAIRKYHTTTGIQDKEICRQWEQTKKLSPSQLLQVLHEIALHEEQFAYFDYLGLFTLCLKLLDFTRTAYYTALAGRLNIHQLGRDLWYFEIVFEVLSEAATEHRRGSAKKQSVLGTIAEYFSTEIARDSNKLVDASRAEITRQLDVTYAIRRASFEAGQEDKVMTLNGDLGSLLAAFHARGMLERP